MMRFAMIVTCLSFLFGCVVTSDNPLSDFEKDRLDRSILGTWVWENEDDLAYLHFGTDRKTGMLRLIWVEVDKDGTIRSDEYAGHTSVLGENRYINLRFLQPEMQAKFDGYLFMKYAVHNSALRIGTMESEFVEKAIESGDLAGRKKENDIVHITDTRKNMQAFFLREDERLFPEMWELKRVDAP